MKKTVVLLLILFVSGCATYPVVKQEDVVNLVKHEKYSQALNLAKQQGFYQEKQNRLLRHLNLGSLHYINKNYYQALKEFDLADEIASEVQTTSITGALLGHNPYKGENYEVSLIKYFQSILHLILYQQGKYESCQINETEKTPEKILSDSEKKMHFDGARAILIDWHSIQEASLIEDPLSKDFTEDILAKTWGSYVHQLHDNFADVQTRHILLKSVNRLIQTSYAKYPFLSELNKKKLQNYIKEQQEAKEAKSLEIVLKTGIIPQKIAHKVEFNINWALALAAVKGDVLFLNMVIPKGISKFEVLRVDKQKIAPSKKILVYQKNGKLVAEKNIPLISSVSDIMYNKYGSDLQKTINERKKEIQTACLIGLGVGHVAYKELMKQIDKISADANLNEWEKIIKKAVVTAEIGAVVALAHSTCNGTPVDIRQWELMPANIFQQSINLKKGKYKFKILSNDKEIYSDNIEIKDNQKVFVDINLPTKQ